MVIDLSDDRPKTVTLDGNNKNMSSKSTTPESAGPNKEKGSIAVGKSNVYNSSEDISYRSRESFPCCHSCNTFLQT
jgi:hypothetical protein